MSEEVPATGLEREMRARLAELVGRAATLEADLAERDRPEHLDDARRLRTLAENLAALFDAAADGGAAQVAELLDAGRRPDAARRLSATHEPSPPSTAELPGEVNPRVLVVADSAVSREPLVRQLERHGYDVIVAASGPAAMAVVMRSPPDLVIVDLGTHRGPADSGHRVLARLRREHDAAELPVILAIEGVDSHDAVRGLAAGANDIVRRPLDVPVVLARAQNQVALKAARDEIRRLADALELRNQFIRQTFGRYVSDEVAESLLHTPGGLELGGELREVTVLMADVRGFTNTAARLEPHQVVELVNTFLGAMAEVVSDHGGTVDEFIGDALLATFGAPIPHRDHARRAVGCALRMQQAMAQVNDANQAADLPTIETGIGVNTGPAVVGNIGSRKRAKYGVVGNVVNLVGRIQGAAFGGHVLVSAATLEAAGEGVEVAASWSFEPKGGVDPLVVADVVGISGPEPTRLVRTPEAMAPLREPLAVEVAVVGEDKRLLPDRHDALVVARSEVGGVVELSGATVAAGTSVRLRFAGTDIDAYATVTGSPDQRGRHPVRFTSLPSAALALLGAGGARPG